MTLRLIVVDGLDGCGKDSHAQRIRKVLEARGLEAELISHPSSRRFGRMAKRALTAQGPGARMFATFFFTADVLASVRRLKRSVDKTFIFVRYLLGAAYLPEPLAPAGYAFFKKLLPFPDLALFIDIEPEVALRRIAARGHRPEMFETRARLEDVRRVAKSLVRDGWVTVDNSRDGEEPFAATERAILEWLMRSG